MLHVLFLVAGHLLIEVFFINFDPLIQPPEPVIKLRVLLLLVAQFDGCADLLRQTAEPLSLQEELPVLHGAVELLGVARILQA